MSFSTELREIVKWIFNVFNYYGNSQIDIIIYAAKLFLLISKS
jgi:hypothetical protein